ncbi:hypothetical protein SAMN05428974_0914 [Sphingopyxis sp. YR583]|uniref:hypothetical protein n=1 Tax=Sphingopyxis sp. YR583 TaxID=1881047 RepID=UPI0008A812B7|nr:hypothetical protein [Sphingopyxis sp. YR583]SEH13717.1 hypothetical protein SAMN05428974_0914 [Sphingopyxis sp. YR583]
MNLVPSDLPRIAGAARLSKPGFDILLAVSSARQAALPTVRQLRAHAHRERHMAKLNALRDTFCGTPANTEQKGPRIVRFFDLSDDVNALPETMNSLFTRGLQPMLNPSVLDPNASDTPPSDVSNME